MERANTIGGRRAGSRVCQDRRAVRPEAFYGNPTGRETFMVVNLDTPAQIAELMYVLTWFTGSEPTFTPISARKYMARPSPTRRRS